MTSGSAVIAAGLIWGLVAWVTAGSSAAPAAVAGYVAGISAHICGPILQILNGIYETGHEVFRLEFDMSDASARKYVTVGFLFLVAGIVFLALSACEVPKPVFKDGLDVLGTSAEIVVVGLTDQQASKAIRAVEKDLERFDHIGYTLESTGELHRLNEAISRNQAMTVSVELKGLIEEAVRLSSASNGLFNPAAGELTALWEYECDKADCTEAPYPEEIKKLVVEKASEVISEQPSMDDLRFDGNEVTSRKTVVKLDLTDIMRGFALDRGMEHLQEMGVENAMIFLGSGVRTLGRKGKKPWWLGVPLVGLQDHMIGTIESRGD